MQDHQNRVERYFEQALDDFPYPNLEVKGEFEPDGDGMIEFSAGYTFDAGQLLGELVKGGGWIELRHDDDNTIITTIFWIVPNGDWKPRDIFPGGTMVLGYYDIQAQQWEFMASH